MSSSTLNQPGAVTLVKCPVCKARSEQGQAFCQQCGERLMPPENRTPARPPESPRKSLGSLTQAQHGKHIRSARITMMVVAVLTMIAAVGFWMMLGAQIAKVESNPAMVLNDGMVRKARVMIWATFGLGVFFLGLYFWAKHDPFAATLTALITYVVVTIASAAFTGASLANGLLVKAIVVALLVRGVKAGLAHRRALEEAGAQ